MKIIKPKLSCTKHSSDLREWVPSSFESFLTELSHIISSCEGENPLPLFRGHINSKWFLDSTFVRNCIQQLFALPNYLDLDEQIRLTVPFHRTIVSLLLLKFGTVGKPSQEAFQLEKDKNIDAWYEWLKNLQQYPEGDEFINGTFLVDWSCSQDIALYFATYRGKGKARSVSSEHGAIWICDAVATGNTFQTKKLGGILSLMSSEEFLNGNKTFPLLFDPPTQTFQPRSKNQVPYYIAQMDFRYDLAEVWASYEEEEKKRVFIKLILSEELKSSAMSYLESQDITENFVYPE